MYGKLGKGNMKKHPAIEEEEAALQLLISLRNHHLNDADALNKAAERRMAQAREDSERLMAQARKDAKRCSAQGVEDAERLFDQSAEDADILMAQGVEDAKRLMAQGVEDAERLWAQAKEDADRLMAQAKEDVKRLMAQGAEDADRLWAQAKEDAKRLMAQAKEDAGRLWAQAKKDAKRLMADARAHVDAANRIGSKFQNPGFTSPDEKKNVQVHNSPSRTKKTNVENMNCSSKISKDAQISCPLPMGLATAPSIFQDKIKIHEFLEDLPYTRAYIDDILIISSKDASDHIQKLDDSCID